MAYIRQGLALLLRCIKAQAQSSSSSNLTITFSPTAKLSTCASRSSSQGITFSTSSIPLVPQCFNLDEIFLTNSSQGLLEQPIAGNNEPFQLTWTVQNRQAYDANANYSRIWYQQDQRHWRVK